MVRSAGLRPPHRRSRDGEKLRPQNLNWVHETDPVYHPNGCYKATEEYNVLCQGLLSTFLISSHIPPFLLITEGIKILSKPRHMLSWCYAD